MAQLLGQLGVFLTCVAGLSPVIEIVCCVQFRPASAVKGTVAPVLASVSAAGERPGHVPSSHRAPTPHRRVLKDTYGHSCDWEDRANGGGHSMAVPPVARAAPLHVRAAAAGRRADAPVVALAVASRRGGLPS